VNLFSVLVLTAASLSAVTPPALREKFNRRKRHCNGTASVMRKLKPPQA
jgi:hypothetical protein